jgi:folate-binding protein YgfZ
MTESTTIDLGQAERLVDESVVAFATSRDLIRATGPDAAGYLHGQLSQDVEGMTVGQTAWTLLLQPQGKVDAWLRLHRRGDDEFWLDVEAGFGAAAVARLERFKLRVDLELSLDEVAVLALRGPDAASVAVGDEVVALPAQWGGIDGVDLFAVEVGAAPPVVDGVEQAPAELAELVRVHQGRPAMGAELDESTIPAAAGVVETSVDFTKGCYVGQELVARVDSRGNNTPTRLHRLSFDDGASVAVGAELTLDGSAVGTVTSVAHSPRLGTIGLGYLKRGTEAPVRLTVSSDGVESAAEASELAR